MEVTAEIKLGSETEYEYLLQILEDAEQNGGIEHIQVKRLS